MDPDKQAALFAAIAKAIGAAQSVSKDAYNGHHGYKYASAEGLIEESRGHLAAAGVCVLTTAWKVTHREVEKNTQRKSEHFADVDVTYLIAHSGGGTMTCEARTPAIRDSGRPEDKAVATALTYSLGYFLRSLLLLPRVDAEHDVDQRDDRQRPNPGRDDRAAQRQPKAERTPATPATPAKPEYDVEYVITAIRAAGDDDTMQIIANDITENAPKSALPRLRAEWGKRKRELLDSKAAA